MRARQDHHAPLSGVEPSQGCLHPIQVRGLLMEAWALRLALADVASSAADMGQLFTANGLQHRRLDAGAAGGGAGASDSDCAGGPGSGGALSERRQRRKRMRERRAERRRRRRRSASGGSDSSEAGAPARQRRRRQSARRGSDSGDAGARRDANGMSGSEFEVLLGGQRVLFAAPQAAEVLAAAALETWLMQLMQRTDWR